MNKILATLALVVLLSVGSCARIPREQADPLVLPYPLYEQEYKGNQVSITLQTSPDGPGVYNFQMNAHVAEGQTRFGIYIISVVLTEGYRQGKTTDWTDRFKGQTGSGGLWEGEALSGEDVTSSVAFGLGDSADHPTAIFVRLVADDPKVSGVSYDETVGPVAVLHILPDGQGVVRLDQ